MNRSFSFWLSAALLLLGICPGRAVAQSLPTYQWVQGAYLNISNVWGLPIDPQATAISADHQVVTAYNPKGPATFGPFRVTTLGPSAALVRYDATGTPVQMLLTGDSAAVSDIHIDDAGNIYATGYFSGNVTTGGLTIAPGRYPEAVFVAKWNSVGMLQWLKQANLSRPVAFDPSRIAHLGVDAAGRVSVLAHLRDSLTVSGTTLHNTTSIGDMRCVLQYDAAGTLRWATDATDLIGVARYIIASDLAVDVASGAILVVGTSDGAPFQWQGASVGVAGGRTFWMSIDPVSGTLRHSFTVPVTPNAYPSLIAAGDGASYWSASFVTPLATLRINGAPVALSGQIRSQTIVARLDASGVPQWTVAPPPGVISHEISAMTAGGNHTNDDPASSAAAPTLYLTGYFSTVTAHGPWAGLTLPRTDSTYNSSFLAALDGLSGRGRWIKTMLDTTYLRSHGSPVSMAVAPSGHLVLAGIWGTHFDHVTLPLDSLGNLPPSFTAKLLPAYNQVTGTAFADTNGDGQPSAGERRFGGLIVETQPDELQFSTAPSGGYTAVVELSTQAVTLPSLPLYYSLPAAPAAVMFSSFGNVAANRHFALQPIPNQQDVQAFVTPVTNARPGFALRYRVTYRNVGTMTLSGTVAVQLDSRLTYLGNFGGGTVSGGVLTAPYTALAPYESRSFDIQFQVPTTVAAGTVLLTTATVEPVSTDLTPADNSETNRHTVTASYDPNDLQVNWTRLTPQQVTAGEWLEYTIRFENTGTDTAFSILLRDTLPTQLLSLGTLQFIASSHSCSYRLTPGGLLTVQFSSIRLPYRNINALASMGFVRFRVKPRATLAVGDVVPNQVEIHFDYNAPLATNTALTTVGNPAGLSATPADDVRVWPNPASGTLNVEAATDLPALTLLDVVGRPVRTFAASAHRTARLDVRGLPAGLYLLRGQSAAGTTFTRRVVVR